MIPYYILFVLITPFAFLDSVNVKEGQRKLILFVLLFILIFFSTFRGNIGFQDYDEYVAAYLDIVQNGLYTSNYTSSAAIFEPGFVFSYYLCTFFSSNPVFGLFVISSIAISINLLSYQKYSRYFLLAILLYFVHTFVLREMLQIRAGVAASICLYSISYIEERKIWYFLFLLLIAMSFHLASVIFLFVYIIYTLNWNKYIWMWFVGLSLLLGIIMPMGRFLSSIPLGGIGERISVYIWMIGVSSGIFTNPTIIKQLFFILISFIYWDYLIENVPHFKIMILCLMMSVCWLMLWNDFPIIAGRLGTFFSVTEVLVVPSFLYLFTPKSRLLVGGLIVFYAFLTLYLNLNSGNFVFYNESVTALDIK